MTGATLRRRDDGSIELRVNGVFVMDDVETTSEELLGRAVLDLGAKDILVGGLGLGHTLRTLLSSPGVRRVVVAELHPEIADWMRNGTIPGADLLADARTEVVLDDVRAVVAAQPHDSLDAIVLDVDNGPDFLVHDANAEVYGAYFLATCAERLRPGGAVCIWSMRESPELSTTMRGVLTKVTEQSIPVQLQGRAEKYWIYIGTRQDTVGAAD
jgi:spermidine synthase